MRITLLAIVATLVACGAKPQLSVAPCDEDLGYTTGKMHLSNVKFLDEERQVDWFEIYENLEERRKNTPPQNCIPGTRTPTIEQQIERNEHDLKNLR
jgi:hypothetical protein